MNLILNETQNTSLQAFKDYVGLKLHFHGDLIWKPDLRLRITEETLQNRRDGSFFHKAAVKYRNRSDYVDIMVSSFYRDREFWIGDLEHQENLAFHKRRMRRYGALLHTFRTDVGSIIEYMTDNGVTIKELLNPNEKPLIIKDARKIIGGVTEETLATLDYFFDFCGRVRTTDLLWNQQAAQISRYKYFCRPDPDLKPEFERLIYKLIGTSGI